MKTGNSRVGLYFGSFNPIHIGHLLIASFILEDQYLDEVRLVISPLNPFKESKGMLGHEERLLLAKAALLDQEGITASDIEFSLPIPSYTIDTVKALQEREPEQAFSLIMGEDNLESFHKWKEHEDLVERLENIFVYPRIGYDGSLYQGKTMVTEVQAPIVGISSTQIRNRIKEGKSIDYWLHPKVRDLVYKHGFYNL